MPKSKMNLSRLQYFVAVAETGSITAAAKRLEVSKSVVSKQLTLLEQEHSVSLLRRNSRGQSLTDIGEVFYERARQVVEFGHDISDDNGGYNFRTIKPGKYPGRTPHIHVKVFDGEEEVLTTQFYVAGDLNNERDNLFRRMSVEQAESVSMVYVEVNGEVETTINVQV